MASTSSAVVRPLLTRAISTAKAPATKAPMIGMKAPKKVSTASGTTRGTPRTSSPSPMKKASMNPTKACWRMNSDRVDHVFIERAVTCRAARGPVWAASQGTQRGPSLRKKKHRTRASTRLIRLLPTAEAPDSA